MTINSGPSFSGFSPAALASGCKVEVDELEAVLRSEVLKRDVFDSDEAKQATDFIKKAARSAERAKAKAAADNAQESTVAVAKDQAQASSENAA